MLDENRVEEILSEICESFVRKRNGGFNARCPICGDSKKSKRKRRLHIDWYQKYDSWVCTCYNGGCSFRSGNIYSLYAEARCMSFDDARKYIDQDTYDTEQIKKRLSKSHNDNQVELSGKTGTLDLGKNDIIAHDAVVDDRIHKRYLKALKSFMTTRQINHPCFVAHDGKYKNRFIIPVYINDEMVYFQGRAISDITEPKYLNPEVDKSDIIMNSDKFDSSKYIIVTEGIIDAWMVENNQGTSVLGGYFDDDFIGKLFKMTDKGVILCFDNPYIDNAGMETLTMFLKESDYKDKVKYFLPNRKDFKDLNDLRRIHEGSIYNYILDNSFSSLNIRVKLSLNL